MLHKNNSLSFDSTIPKSVNSPGLHIGFGDQHAKYKMRLKFI